MGSRYGGGYTALFALFLALAAPFSPAQTLGPPPPAAKSEKNKKERPVREDVEWLWQYTQTKDDPSGRENDLVQDPHFRPFLDQFLTAPQSFWGTPIDGRPRSLATAALDHLTIPDKVLADENRYVAITGCVIHFCPARGLLWVDLNGSHHLVVFAAIDWIKEGRPTTDPTAEYTLWLFPSQPLTIASTGAQHPPTALLHAISRWTAQPLAGSAIVQNITHAILVDPDGTPHEIAPAALGVATPKSTSTEPEAAPLKPRN